MKNEEPINLSPLIVAIYIASQGSSDLQKPMKLHEKAHESVASKQNDPKTVQFRRLSSNLSYEQNIYAILRLKHNYSTWSISLEAARA